MDLVQASAAYRAELLAHCYRMLGSLHDAEDLVQETMLRAWRFAGRYDESRGSIRTWLYRIATNACLSYLQGRQRRVLPVDLSEPSQVRDIEKIEEHLEIPWLEPFPDALVPSPDPAAVVEARESIRLAFIAALQLLPPRQRAVLILRDVLAMPATEVAALLEMTLASVNSALQRARAQLAAASPSVDDASLVQPSDEEAQDLLDRYTAAFTAMDTEALKQTLREDALLQMPPFPEWFLGRDAIGEFLTTGFARGGSYRFVQTRANGQPAVCLYRRRDSEAYRFLHVQVLTITETGIARIDGFHAGELYAPFGLPAALQD
ncbi:MAG TPA: RNA polymerase subunit sigma-70 [Streptosporangiaceae bacterium]|nr:RNA polymerase subunit sigma-70 [Streptosporangiaceae bacterium]